MWASKLNAPIPPPAPDFQFHIPSDLAMLDIDQSIQVIAQSKDEVLSLTAQYEAEVSFDL